MHVSMLFVELMSTARRWCAAYSIRSQSYEDQLVRKGDGCNWHILEPHPPQILRTLSESGHNLLARHFTVEQPQYKLHDVYRI